MIEKDFEFNGVSLVDKRWDIEYIPEGIPKKRGTNTVIPYADGARFSKKLYDQRTVTLNLWVWHCDANGVFKGREQLEENMEYLKQLLGIPGLVQIRKQMIDETWRKSFVEVVDAIDFQRKDGSDPHRVLSLSLQFPDPFWYSENQEIIQITPTSANYSYVLNNPGTAPLRKMQILLADGLSSPKVLNNTSNVYLKLNKTIADGETITVDTEKFTALSSLDGNVINSLIHSGDMSWMLLHAGDNNLTISGDEMPIGTITFKFYPAYF